MLLGKPLVVGQVVFKLPRVVPFVGDAGRAALVAGDVVQRPARVLVNFLIDHVGAERGAQFEVFGEVDAGVHVAQHGLGFHVKKAVAEDIDRVAPAFHTGIVFVAAPAPVRVLDGNNWQRFQHLPHGNDASRTQRIDLVFLLVVVAQRTTHLNPVFDLAVEHETTGVPLQIRLFD